jgi:hypothetical protein
MRETRLREALADSANPIPVFTNFRSFQKMRSFHSDNLNHSIMQIP